MAKDYYKVLGVEKHATPEEIKSAFRRLAHQYHTDKSTGDATKFKEINEAYQVLSDKDKRAQYDQYGQTFEQAQSQGGFGGFEGFRDWSNYAQAGGFNAQDIGDIFGNLGDMFGMGGGRRGRAAAAARGRDLETTVTVDFTTMVMGGTVELNIQRDVACDQCKGTGAKGGTALKTCGDCGGNGQRATTRQTMFGVFQSVGVCPTCRGTGKIIETKCDHCRGRGTESKKEDLRVEVPPGIDDGMTLRLKGKGEAVQNGTTGDLFIHVRVRPHHIIKRIPETADLVTSLTVNVAEAALGTTKTIDAIEEKLDVEVPAGIGSGQRLRVKGKGIQTNRGRGDLYVQVTVETPKRLSRNAKRLLEELQKEL
ncbi:DnaJ domain-containing protein [Candidatus Uhrbacteria bacterium]|nr:DnaJ domain-containing protein [Candidatus Uhrbacteria bacterium]